MAVITPSESDRLYKLATDLQIVTQVECKCVTAEHIPPHTDLIIGAHAHAFISAEARHKTKYGAIGYHPSLLPRHRGQIAQGVVVATPQNGQAATLEPAFNKLVLKTL